MTVKGRTVIVPQNRGLCYFPNPEPWNPHRPVKIIVTGAGIGGVASAVLLSRKVPNASISVYDRLDKIGGTWAANVYPGVRCDVPSHAYQWSEYYPKGAEIQQYYERVVAKYGLTDDFHLRHEVLKASWISESSQWEVEIKNLESGDVFIQRADFLVSSQGRISVPKFPDVPGLDTYKGRVVHTARWPNDFDYKNKRVAVIGNGASGQQLVPNIVKDVEHIDHYVRSKTWVTPTFAGDLFVATADKPGGPEYSEETRKKFRDSPEFYLEHRRAFNAKLHIRHPGAEILGSQANQDLRDRITEVMLERLDGDEEWLRRVVPDYSPGCKRLTPAPGYLESLKGPKVDYVTSKILRVEEGGIVTEDGNLRRVDAIIAATGFENGFTTRFPVIGKDGVDLREKWSATGAIGYPETYFGVMAPGFPNYFTVLQAQGNARGGTVPLQIEISATYIAKCIRKIQSQSYSSLTPRQDATQEFNDIVNGHFTNKVTSDTCSSWFKQGPGKTRTVIAWPGTYHHRADILRDPRWEDFEFERRSDARLNRYEYFSDGSTVREKTDDEKELTKYLRAVGDIDIATVHEAWNE
ncbi:putative flavoprotein CzcO associated with the cation diffusion facilitator CzcD [Geosmithia morbida]|uniref:Flavoprotein CzcO associated with the cation diffusion facilitator CzcD n=1 Tax=Geosmithia morbida TaxID=1094350 RepID=A0A9P4YUU2_9HYPO|nr:putative flavoprotein CzcO associated with the cation diffusion facilitator CzcD [Geosmithia morbida]KAF4122227.1 putative flavoprotein CzcO associated with the cation diffusion facilitator CzcD [Geosmithia morbida]